jgi:hypothetical protein
MNPATTKDQLEDLIKVIVLQATKLEQINTD